MGTWRPCSTLKAIRPTGGFTPSSLMGPYVDDVGRCVPGPPTPDPLPVSLPDGTTFEYRILSVLGASLDDVVVLRWAHPGRVRRHGVVGR